MIREPLSIMRDSDFKRLGSYYSITQADEHGNPGYDDVVWAVWIPEETQINFDNDPVRMAISQAVEILRS